MTNASRLFLAFVALAISLGIASVQALPAQQQQLEERIGAIIKPQPFHGNGRRDEGEEMLEKRIGAIIKPQPFHGNGRRDEGDDEVLEKRIGAIIKPQPFHGNGRRDEGEEMLEKRIGAIIKPQPFHGNGRRDEGEEMLEKRVGAIIKPQPFHGPAGGKRDVAAAAAEAGVMEKRIRGKPLDKRSGGASASAGASVGASLAKRASVCNGDASLCDRLYSNVTYVGTHNSYAVGRLNQAQVGYNQAKTVKQQLDEGVRLLQVQAHANASAPGSGIDLCHTSCSLVNGGSLESYLSTVKSWLDSNPNEVVTLIIVNSDDQPASKFGTAFQSTGLDSKAYAPSSASVSKNSWPTLGALIDAGKPLVTFIDNSADTSSVPYILPEFNNVWENPYGQTTYPFSCNVDRIDQSASAGDLMYMANHYLDSQSTLFGVTFETPKTDQLGEVNGDQAVLSGAQSCAAQHGSYPTFILLDFYDTGYGGPFKAAAAMNNVAYVNRTTSATAGSGGGSSSSGSGGSSAAPSSLVLSMPSALLAASLSIGAGLLLL
ncbi:uncharacterized protein PFL1_00687 [Pseudozyma flocculosa PF-1]|uniref:PLC-like phosphodiesterase n=1 Tax=Pseudozyma flocculosa TaxID=84751 RepID=A0A5C3F438_9BASI|nr:uncharacterized protein PFL1_00687 [Pseudozyma flocculosa PF-1]EPQ31352.1 hypothetical protein PFL1_00687 [Pseudozyma flocculosa PF-1]SPO38870.1 uncharacterized protein PSFLO_04349 [Pseudozyma flocculosa]